MNTVGQPIPKTDSRALTTGKPVYTDDLAPKECLIVRLLRSPHAHAEIEEIDVSRATALEGVALVLTYKDVPQKRFTIAGQRYPETSPYDRLILDKKVRYIGDPVAIIAADTEKTANKAMRLIKIKYKLLPAVLDMETALDSQTVIHDEKDYSCLVDIGGDQKRNLCAHEDDGMGDVEAALEGCRYVVEAEYRTKANQQTMMETFRAYSYMEDDRLNVVTSTQVPFHVRRILSNALELKKTEIRVIKPRIGGGFGSKQTAVCEMYPAIVTLKTGRPAKIVYTREENMTASCPRHEAVIKVRVGADDHAIIKAIDVRTLTNTGAYGEHSAAVAGLTGHKSIPIYGHLDAYRFSFDVVYTNKMAAGAYRGFGATQGFFAVESAVNELAAKIGLDPAMLRELNMVSEGQVMPAYYGEVNSSCALDKCLERAVELFRWDDRYPRRVMPNGKVRGVGMAMAMQGSGISSIDVGSAEIKADKDGRYSLSIGAADMGTGCDTILAQIAAETLMCGLDKISVNGVDTDVSPYDTGSYASSTTYVTGMAVVTACERLVDIIKQSAAEKMKCDPEDTEFDGTSVFLKVDITKRIALAELETEKLVAQTSHTSKVSPPPFMVGMAEVEIDPETGVTRLTDFTAVVDCGTVINPALARVQAEGGIVQGLGMALLEDIHYTEAGRVMENSLAKYKIPSRLDVGSITVDFAPSYEKSGPYGAKSIGEIVINTTAPAIADAVANAVGLRFRQLPIKAENIALALARRPESDDYD